MSGNAEWRELHHAQQDLKRDLVKMQGTLQWIQLMVILSLAVGLVTFVLMLAR